MVDSELLRFYHPLSESARSKHAEKQLYLLNGQSPVGKWIKGQYNGISVNGFVTSIKGYGIVDVHWVKNKVIFDRKGTVIGFHGGNFEFYDIELQNSDIDSLIDLALDVRDFKWVSELRNLKYFK